MRYLPFCFIVCACTFQASAIPAADDSLPASAPVEKADLVVVEKKSKILSLFKNERRIASFSVAFGANPVGHKQQEGDERTPEGRYKLDYKKTETNYHKAIHISYPNAQDIADAKKRGVSPGGAIMIHGQKKGWGWAAIFTQRINWTNGCIALADDDLDFVWNAVDVGTPIEIKP
jgi:murein L,D-transpeptidase YafK